MPIIILYLIHSFILIDLMRNEIKKIICYNDIKEIDLGDNQIMITFKQIIFGVILFFTYFLLIFYLNSVKKLLFLLTKMIIKEEM